MNNLPKDQDARERFAFGLDTNFSLVCPAGSGKTHSISDRIVSLAKRPNAAEILPKLVVVTYTNASADEMHARAREFLLRAKVPWEVQRAFDFAFFGTIHSFASRLLRSYGHRIGLPPVFEVGSEDADSIWGRFVRRISLKSIGGSHQVLRHYPIQEVLKLVKEWDCMRHPGPTAQSGAPEFDFSAVYNFELPNRKDTAANIEAFQLQLKRFEAAFRGNGEIDFQRLPIPKKGGKKFVEVAQDCLEPVNKWLNEGVCRLAYELANEFRDFRVKEGVLLFDDIIYLARKLLMDEHGKVDVRKEEFIILLDEAQDTDPYQFDYLIEAVRPMHASGLWRESPNAQRPGPGRFSMVGDLQQSIHSKRADLSVYRQAIDYIADSPCGSHLSYEVTFRCDKEIVNTAESLFSELLSGKDEQVPYVPISAREDAGVGGVFRLEVDAGDEPMNVYNACLHESKQIASALLAMRDAGQIGRWNEVAIICPRKSWFAPLSRGLRESGITSQFLSYGTKLKDSVAWSWVAAFCRAFTCPSDVYETVGLLRDVFGHSDVELFEYSKGNGERFILNGQRDESMPVCQTLNRLSILRKACLRKSLLDGVNLVLEEVRVRLSDNREELQMLDRIESIAAKAEKRGADLEAFSDEMIKGLNSDLETAGENPNDSVQFITDLKAKGLQWETVILPCVFNSLYTPNDQYPKLVGGRLEPASIALSGDDITSSEKERMGLKVLHELERRLYVSFTRPKHTLIVCDDEELFSPTAKAFLPSMGKALRAGQNGDLSAKWNAIPKFDVLFVDQKAGDLPHSPEQSVISIDLDKVREFASPRMNRVRPYRAASSYHNEEREFIQDDVTTIDGFSGRPSSITYGVWWHETMNLAPWNSRDEAKAFLEASIDDCPDFERGRMEIAGLLNSALCEMIFSGIYIIRTEMPFQYACGDSSSIEGIMDFALYNPQTNHWIVVDWKTNRNMSTEAIRAQYAGQIEAYKDAIECLVESSTAQAGVFSTANSEHLMLEAISA